MGLGNAADVPLWTRGQSAPAGWFDRVMFDMHASADAPWLFIAAGKTPGTQVRDGSIVFVDRVAQRNLRFSSAGLGDTEIGPLQWQVLEPSRRWQLRLADNPSGIAFDVEWRSRGPVWSQTADGDAQDDGVDGVDGNSRSDGRDDAEPPIASWADQSGVYSGWLSVDGARRRVDGWLGQRTRIRGFGNPLTEHGMRVWAHGQFDDWTLSLALSEPRPGTPPRVFGAVQPTDAGSAPDPIVAAQHRLSFDEDADCRSARLVLTTAGGARFTIDADPGRHRGGHMAGGGFGGWFGVPRGDLVESERWPLRGAAGNARPISPYAGRLCRFVCSGDLVGTGSGIFGVARPRAYRYEPTLRRH
ncbi:hypothetical protein [Jatrophihabitans fulvus]